MKLHRWLLLQAPNSAASALLEVLCIWSQKHISIHLEYSLNQRLTARQSCHSCGTGQDQRCQINPELCPVAAAENDCCHFAPTHFPLPSVQNSLHAVTAAGRVAAPDRAGGCWAWKQNTQNVGLINMQIKGHQQMQSVVRARAFLHNKPILKQCLATGANLPESSTQQIGHSLERLHFCEWRCFRIKKSPKPHSFSR